MPELAPAIAPIDEAVSPCARGHTWLYNALTGDRREEEDVPSESKRLQYENWNWGSPIECVTGVCAIKVESAPGGLGLVLWEGWGYWGKKLVLGCTPGGEGCVVRIVGHFASVT